MNNWWQTPKSQSLKIQRAYLILANIFRKQWLRVNFYHVTNSL